jgi:hypothetical protein
MCMGERYSSSGFGMHTLFLVLSWSASLTLLLILSVLGLLSYFVFIGLFKYSLETCFSIW